MIRIQIQILAGLLAVCSQLPEIPPPATACCPRSRPQLQPAARNPTPSYSLLPKIPPPAAACCPRSRPQLQPAARDPTPSYSLLPHTPTLTLGRHPQLSLLQPHPHSHKADTHDDDAYAEEGGQGQLLVVDHVLQPAHKGYDQQLGHLEGVQWAGMSRVCRCCCGASRTRFRFRGGGLGGGGGGMRTHLVEAD